MKNIFLFLIIFSFNISANECGEKILLTVKNYKFTKATDTREMQKVFLKTLVCLGDEKHLELNVEVMKMYARAAKFDNFFEHFELLFPHYHKHLKFFKTKIHPKLNKNEIKLIESHYRQSKDMMDSPGNG